MIIFIFEKKPMVTPQKPLIRPWVSGFRILPGKRGLQQRWKVFHLKPGAPLRISVPVDYLQIHHGCPLCHSSPAATAGPGTIGKSEVSHLHSSLHLKNEDLASMFFLQLLSIRYRAQKNVPIYSVLILLQTSSVSQLSQQRHRVFGFGKKYQHIKSLMKI